jgi:hypothetical protein
VNLYSAIRPGNSRTEPWTKQCPTLTIAQGVLSGGLSRRPRGSAPDAGRGPAGAPAEERAVAQ